MSNLSLHIKAPKGTIVVEKQQGTMFPNPKSSGKSPATGKGKQIASLYIDDWQ